MSSMTPIRNGASAAKTAVGAAINRAASEAARNSDLDIVAPLAIAICSISLLLERDLHRPLQGKLRIAVSERASAGQDAADISRQCRAEAADHLAIGAVGIAR